VYPGIVMPGIVIKARNVLFGLGLMSCVGSAASMATETGDNAVIIEVTKVAPPAKLPGLCRLKGVVQHVWDGKAFRPGEEISLKVPCGSGGYLIPVADTDASNQAHFVDFRVLEKSKRGAAHIDDAGNLLWQPSKRSYDSVGRVAGYRVLDGVALPVAPG
jgi:hypothetical protein